MYVDCWLYTKLTYGANIIQVIKKLDFLIKGTKGIKATNKEGIWKLFNYFAVAANKKVGFEREMWKLLLIHVWVGSHIRCPVFLTSEQYTERWGESSMWKWISGRYARIILIPINVPAKKMNFNFHFIRNWKIAWRLIRLMNW